MFKFIFRFIVTVMFLVFVIIVLSMWKGGKPFIWLGKNIQYMGGSVIEFGDFVDDVIAGSKKIKDVIDTD